MAQIPSKTLENTPWYRFRHFQNGVRVAVLCDPAGIAQWMEAALQQILTLPQVALERIFEIPALAPVEESIPRSFRKLQEWSLAGAVDPFSARPEAFPDIIRVRLDTEESGEVTAAARQAIEAQHLDVLLCDCTAPPVGSCAGLARFGVWSFALGEPEFRQYQPPYWREAYQQRDVSRIFLMHHQERFETAGILAELATGTISRLRFTLNQTAPLEAAGGLLGRTLLEAAERGTVGGSPVSTGPSEVRQRWPNNLEVAAFSARKIAESAAYRYRARKGELTWFVAIREVRGDLEVQRPLSGATFRELVAPRGHWYADPFVVESGSNHWLFVEDWVEEEGRGSLSCMQIHEGGGIGEPTTILRQPYHLSYPHVFSHRGEFFLIPESAESGQVQLYRASRFPTEWELEAVLAEGVGLVDTTAFEHDGTWYFFTSTLGQPEESYLFTSQRLDGQWHYHPANPISSDTRRLRGAGSVFSQGGRIIRPTQDCSVGYGHAIVLNAVGRLSPTEYQERQAGAIDPSWTTGLVGTHTYNRDSKFEVVDGLKPIGR